MEKMPNRPTRLAVLERLIGEQEARIDQRDDGADHEDQDQQAQIFLAACRSLSLDCVADGELQHAVLAELRCVRGSR